MKYLVIGDPVEHSRSPEMQNAAFISHGLPPCYGKLRVLPAEMAGFIDYARRELDGFNATVPHKTVLLPYLDEISAAAQAAGSVNFVKIKNGLLCGDSTDGYGLEAALKNDLGVDVAGKTLLFIGAGGAAHATCYHMAGRGVKQLLIANRTPERAEALARGVAEFAPGCQTSAAALACRATLEQWFAQSDVLIQATSAGLRDDDPPPFDLELLKINPALKVFDAIYRPTPLLRAAKSLGLQAADGESMLIYQGARSFELWTGLKAPIDAMRAGFHAKDTIQ